MKSGIYYIKNLINGKRYIGSTSKNVHYRINIHLNNLRKDKHVNPHLQHAWNFYGEEAFECGVIEFVESNKALEREQYWIDHYDSTETGYNIRKEAKSNRGLKHSPKQREAIRQRLLGRPRTEATKEKLRLANLGKKLSAETKAKISEAGKGRRNTQKQKEKTRERFSKTWRFLSPIGEIVEIYNLLDFCRENDLTYRCMQHVFFGTQIAHKGWKRIHG